MSGSSGVVETSGTTRVVGAALVSGGAQFRIWAPVSSRVDIVMEDGVAAGVHALEPDRDGWFSGRAGGVCAGDRYRLRLAGGDVYPDPLSRWQPDGVHGASAIVDHSAFRWTDDGWTGRELDELVIYEAHVGAATPAGTFDGLIERLDEIAAVGATAIEIMPVAEFPGERNWGYDGTYLFAPSRAYGGPDGLRRLVDAAHARGLAVILDVVYNHFGPEGNYLHAVSGGRVFTERHHTPWGAAVNFDADDAAGVREIVLANVTEWVRQYHIDGLRLDATHAIIDTSERHILAEIARTARAAAGWPVTIIAEDERNERTLLLPDGEGCGLDAVWADDWHHSMRRLLAGDSEGYFGAYEGTTAELARAMRRGWLHEGANNATDPAARGTPAAGIPAQRFVHCLQNHDQVGNRALGERLHHDVELPAYRAASVLLLLSPYTPLLWMGQEWAASSPFLYFTDHPEELGRLVTRGRREEFEGFSQFSDPAVRERIPDPQAAKTFERSRLDWAEREREPHAGVLRLYREVLALRVSEEALQTRDRTSWDVRAVSAGAIALRRGGAGSELLVVANLDGSLDVHLAGHAITAPAPGRSWRQVLWTEDVRFAGSDGAHAQLGGGDGADATLRMDGPGALILRA